MRLGIDELTHWGGHGWLRLQGVLSHSTTEALQRWCDEVASWADDDHAGSASSSRGSSRGIHHHEQTDSGPVIARSELFADDHTELGQFMRTGLIVDVLAQLFHEPPVLFKEKINYKHPGGGGFAPHQDASAYRFVDHHISVLVPVDRATEPSGCLWFATGHHSSLLETDGRGRIVDGVVDQLDWQSVEVEPGDLVLFDSYAPHRSDSNLTDQPRRAFYLTYNAASKGDFRRRYYDDKLAEFEREGNSFGNETVRMSINDDFLGRPVEAGGGR
jgi:hypothetical protein